MRYEIYRDFNLSLQELYQKGGRYQKAAERAKQIQRDWMLGEADPLKGVNLTKHGETRIKHCLKYDLTGFCRLITIRDNGVWTLCFVGTHDDCDQWLERNRGLTLIKNAKNELTTTRQSTNIKDKESRITGETDLSDGKLIDRIPSRYIDKIAKNIPWSLMEKFANLTTIDNEDDILLLAEQISDYKQQTVFF